FSRRRTRYPPGDLRLYLLSLGWHDLIPKPVEAICNITPINGVSPDDSRAEVNICAFPTFPQDRRELRTAAGTWGGRNGGGRLIWSFCLAFGRTPPVGGCGMDSDQALHAGAGGGCGRSSAIRRKISWNIC